jgi:uncharacterized protein (TIGR00255 family)
VEANEPLARAIVAGWQGLQRKLKLAGAIDIGMLMARGADLVRVVERRADASADLPQREEAPGGGAQGLQPLARSRGQAPAGRHASRLKHLRTTCTPALRKRTTALVPELARRLTDRVAAVLGKGTVSEERLVQEAALLAERATSPRSSSASTATSTASAELLRQSGSVGKAIDFLIQEIHREVNTIASKSADLDVTNLTLAAKGEIEKVARADAERGVGKRRVPADSSSPSPSPCLCPCPDK